MIPTNPALLPRPFAAEGVASTIPDDKTNFGEASWREGFPTETGLPLNAGGIPPRKADFNGILKALSDHIFFGQSGSSYAWSDALDYRVASLVAGSDDNIYLSLQESGPSVDGVGAKDPTVEDNAPYWLNVTAKLVEPAATQYEICEFYDFRHPTMRPGFVPRYGSLISDAATKYPKAWEYLQTVEGRMLCKTEAEWQAMSTAKYFTAADGTQEGWNGIGGVPFYVQDLGAGTLRVPDTRGMYKEDAGFDSLNVGSVAGPGLPNLTGQWREQQSIGIIDLNAEGCFVKGATAGGFLVGQTASYNQNFVGFDASNSNKIYGNSSVVSPRRFGCLPCVYLGA